MSELGEWAAYLHELEGLSWGEIYERAQQHETFSAIDGLDWHKVRNHGRSYVDGHRDEFPGKPGLDVKQSGENVATVHYRGPQIQTPQDLLDHIGYDPAQWQVVERKVKTYQQTSKREDTHLEYEDGAATGTVDKGGVITVTMFSVYVKLIRKTPIEMTPCLRPVRAERVIPPAKPRVRGGVGRSLFVTDVHTGFRRRIRDGKLDPFHDRAVLDLALQIAAVADVDRVDFGGDNLDATEWTTRFTREPEFIHTTQPALLEFHWWLRQFCEAVPDAEVRVFGGNHDEQRFADSVMNSMLAAYQLSPADSYRLDDPGVLTLPYLLGLESLGVGWVGEYPNGAAWLNERVTLEHGANSKMKPGDYVTVCGHYHTRGWLTETRDTARGPVTGEAFCPGCACRTDYTVPGHKRGQNWQKGFALIDYEIDGTGYGITPIPVDGPRAFWDRRVFEARDRVADLRAAWPGWNW